MELLTTSVKCAFQNFCGSKNKFHLCISYKINYTNSLLFILIWLNYVRQPYVQVSEISDIAREWEPCFFQKKNLKERIYSSYNNQQWQAIYDAINDRCL